MKKKSIKQSSKPEKPVASQTYFVPSASREIELDDNLQPVNVTEKEEDGDVNK